MRKSREFQRQCLFTVFIFVNFQSRDGEPTVKVLVPNISLLENHFSKPLGRSDQLKAPAHFPDALQMYTVQELTVVWHIYGGNDFAEAKRKSEDSMRTGSMSWFLQKKSSRNF